MSDPLTFMMGNHPAPLPAGLRYCKNHMWCRPGADGVHAVGFTSYAVRLMQDEIGRASCRERVCYAV